MKNQHHVILNEQYALYLYLINGNKFNGYILSFPPYQPGTHIRSGSHYCDIPTQNSVEDAMDWAADHLGI